MTQLEKLIEKLEKCTDEFEREMLEEDIQAIQDS